MSKNTIIKVKEEFPRLNQMSKFFSETASGRKGIPSKKIYRGTIELFKGDVKTIKFYEIHDKLRGNFDKHFFSSIPYILEQECRLGRSLLDYSFNKETDEKFVTIYTLGTAEATMARTLGLLGNGKIKTFSCSPTKENRDSFFSHGIPEHSSFYVGPYFNVTKDLLKKNKEYFPFINGFDVIVEDTTFQMYGKNRDEQIKKAKSNLKEDGLFIFIEKFNHENIDEYIKREEQKDQKFKSRFFTMNELEIKKKDILSIMNNQQITLHEFNKILKDNFGHAAMIWNSGNFYSIIASDSEENLSKFLSILPPTYIPNEYCYESLPKILFGLENIFF
ncbi:hypothetical protein [Niallia sp. 01092]|uniref:hypothetical protein n=1 Tax=unclassified Niallia TaxID=2837522 RepID=UPI003FD1CE01